MKIGLTGSARRDRAGNSWAKAACEVEMHRIPMRSDFFFHQAGTPVGKAPVKERDHARTMRIIRPSAARIKIHSAIEWLRGERGTLIRSWRSVPPRVLRIRNLRTRETRRRTSRDAAAAKPGHAADQEAVSAPHARGG